MSLRLQKPSGSGDFSLSVTPAFEGDAAAFSALCDDIVVVATDGRNPAALNDAVVALFPHSVDARSLGTGSKALAIGFATHRGGGGVLRIISGRTWGRDIHEDSVAHMRSDNRAADAVFALTASLVADDDAGKELVGRGLAHHVAQCPFSRIVVGPRTGAYPETHPGTTAAQLQPLIAAPQTAARSFETMTLLELGAQLETRSWRDITGVDLGAEPRASIRGVAALVYQLLWTLSTLRAHLPQWVHGDLKADNVLIGGMAQADLALEDTADDRCAYVIRYAKADEVHEVLFVGARAVIIDFSDVIDDESRASVPSHIVSDPALRMAPGCGAVDVRRLHDSFAHVARTHPSQAMEAAATALARWTREKAHGDAPRQGHAAACPEFDVADDLLDDPRRDLYLHRVVLAVSTL